MRTQKIFRSVSVIALLCLSLFHLIRSKAKLIVERWRCNITWLSSAESRIIENGDCISWSQIMTRS